MPDCFILVGPEKWCQNHIDFLSKNKESYLLYDKISGNPILENRTYEMINAGDFQTFIYVSRNWGGKGQIEYVAYSSPVKNIHSAPWISRRNLFFLQKELIESYKEYTKEKGINENLIPTEPPGLMPEWDYYDFGVSRHPFYIKDLKEYMKIHSPRKYKIAVRICAIQKIEPTHLDNFTMYGGGSINTGFLNKSFIVARTKNDYRNLFHCDGFK